MDYVGDKIQVNHGEPSERILFIASNLQYVQEWCRLHLINPRSRNVKIVTRFSDLRGVRSCYYVDLGTNDPDVRELADLLKSRGIIKPLLTPNS